MKYPALVTDTKKLSHNIRVMQGLCRDSGVSFCAVSKCFCAQPKITKVFYDAGVRDFADTRIANLKQIKFADGAGWLLRAPMLSEINDAVKYSDVSLNSEIKTITALSRSAQKQNKTHKVVLMVDLGDLREGVMPADALSLAGEIIKLKNITLFGVGANFNCFGGVIPTQENLAVLTDIARQITQKFGIDLPVVSGGNSGSVHFLLNRNIPNGINHLRIGESVLFGNETSFRANIDGMHADVFRLDAQIIELKKKPSKPMGIIGTNAFGEAAVFEDKGEMLRAILAIGRQDVDISKITPLDPAVALLGQSSDHTIADLTRASAYKVGDVLSFALSYGSLLSLSTSKYVFKTFI